MAEKVVFLEDYGKKILKNKPTNDKNNIIITKQDRIEAYDMIFGDDDDFIDSFLEEYVKKEM